MHIRTTLQLSRTATIVFLCALNLVTISCSATTVNTAAASATNTSCTGPTCLPGTGIQNASVFIEPDAGYQFIIEAIQSAKKTVRVEMYLLTVRDIINALESAAHKDVNIQVMLEGHPYGSSGSGPTPQETIATLQSAGVQAKVTNPAFALTHSKLMIIDDTAAYISTANFTKSALGGSSSATNREYIVKDTEMVDIQECERIFDGDWNRQTPSLSDANLLISPINSRAKTMALLGKATTSLDIEEEEMVDGEFVQTLVAAVKRGVKVTVIVPKPDSSGDDAKNEETLKQGGVIVIQEPDNYYYIHAKVIVVDGTLAYVGSINASTSSFDKNREIGVLVADHQSVQQIEVGIKQDKKGGV
jgi:cardiolipin synthase A/B